MAVEYESLQFLTNVETFSTAYNGGEQLFNGSTWWTVDPDLIPPGATVKVFGLYVNDPGISATVRVRFAATPGTLLTGTLLVSGSLVPDQGFFSFEAALPAISGIGFLVITLESDGSGADEIGLGRPGVAFNIPLPPPPPTTPADPGGFGHEAFGDPFGSGGPLHVVRARAIEGQTIRVVFDEEPIHVSAAGLTDALNPSNYDVQITVGQGADPQVVGVKRAMVVGPTLAVQGGTERAFDIQVDRPLIRNLTYEVTVVRVLSKLGGILGVPFSADTQGTVLLQDVVAPATVRDVNDIANDPVLGGFAVDASGDIANQDQQSSYRKRVTRRLITVKDAFRALPGYGLGLDLKSPMSIRRLAELKLDIVQQVMAEPETASVKPILTLNALGFLTVQLDIKTKKGAFVQVNLTGATGEVVIT